MTTYQDIINEEKKYLWTQAAKERIGKRVISLELEQHRNLAEAAMLIVASTPERRNKASQSVYVPCDLIDQLINRLEELNYDPKKFRTKAQEARRYCIKQARQAYKARNQVEAQNV